VHAAFTFAIVACLVAAAASSLRGGRMVDGDDEIPVAAPLPHRLTSPGGQHAA
jgi:hypothetical protein